MEDRHYKFTLFDDILYVSEDVMFRDVEKVIYNDPATIVIWNDGTKTVVKCHEGDRYDPEKGFLLCCAKKLFGNTGRYNDVMRKHAKPKGVVEVNIDYSAIAKVLGDAYRKELGSYCAALVDELNKKAEQ